MQGITATYFIWKVGLPVFWQRFENCCKIGWFNFYKVLRWQRYPGEWSASGVGTRRHRKGIIFNFTNIDRYHVSNFSYPIFSFCISIYSSGTIGFSRSMNRHYVEYAIPENSYLSKLVQELKLINPDCCEWYQFTWHRMLLILIDHHHRNLVMFDSPHFILEPRGFLFLNSNRIFGPLDCSTYWIQFGCWNNSVRESSYLDCVCYFISNPKNKKISQWDIPKPS